MTIAAVLFILAAVLFAVAGFIYDDPRATQLNLFAWAVLTVALAFVLKVFG